MNQLKVSTQSSLTIHRNYLKAPQLARYIVTSIVTTFRESSYFALCLRTKKNYEFLSYVVSRISPQSCTEDKMGAVLSQQFELQRRMDMIEWSEQLLRLLRSVLPPADFLAAW